MVAIASSRRLSSRLCLLFLLAKFLWIRLLDEALSSPSQEVIGQMRTRPSLVEIVPPTGLPGRQIGRIAFHFSFTNSKTKIAHTPTVIGNCTNTASRTPLPLGSANVSKSIAKAVSVPRANLAFEFIVVLSPCSDPYLCTLTQCWCVVHHPRKQRRLQLIFGAKDKRVDCQSLHS